MFQRIFSRAVLPVVFILAALTTGAHAKDIWVYESGAWHIEHQPSIYESGAWHNWKDAWIYEGGVWKPFYSTITVSASTASGSGSGASTSGTVSTTSGPGTTTGGTPIGSPTFAWAYVSGDSGINANSSTLQNPTWSKTITGVACNSSSNPTALWNVTATDPATGRQATSSNITVSLTWNNTGSCFTPHSDVETSGSGNLTIPSGAGHVTITRVGGGAAGGNAVFNIGRGDNDGGQGGGSGGISSQTIAISSSDWGNTIAWTVGAQSSGEWPAVAGTSSTSGSVAAGSVAGSATGGAGGTAGGFFVSGAGAGGSPGGNNGGAGGEESGGSGGASPSGDGYGAGGDGGADGGGNPGNDGKVQFDWNT